MAGYRHQPKHEVLTPAAAAARAQEAAEQLRAANKALREALAEHAELAAAANAANLQDSHLREQLHQQARLTRFQNRRTAAELAVKYADTKYGGREGLELAAAEMAEHEARKRAQKAAP
jgi:hypothetical protein